MHVFVRAIRSSMLNKIIMLSFAALLGAVLLGLGGCTSFKPYKMEIRQGNFITPEMRAKVRVGMSRQQVMTALGSPLISDVFHANRWDYIYRYAEKGQLVEQQRLTVFFEADFVKRIDDSQLAASANSPASTGK